MADGDLPVCGFTLGRQRGKLISCYTFGADALGAEVTGVNIDIIVHRASPADEDGVTPAGVAADTRKHTGSVATLACRFIDWPAPFFHEFEQNCQALTGGGPTG